MVGNVVREIARVAVGVLERGLDDLAYHCAVWANSERIPLSMNEVGSHCSCWGGPPGGHTSHLNADLVHRAIEPDVDHSAS